MINNKRRYSTVAALVIAAQVALGRDPSKAWDGSDKRQEEEEDDDWVRFAHFDKAIGYWGYSYEPYEVTTRDGFRLTLFRITAGPPEGYVRPEISSSDSEKDIEELTTEKLLNLY